MKAGTAFKGAELSAAILAAPEFSPEVAEAKASISGAIEVIDVRDSLVAMVEDCIVSPLNGETMSESYKVSSKTVGTIDAREFADKVNETLPPLLIIGAGLLFSGMAISDYLNKHRKKLNITS